MASLTMPVRHDKPANDPYTDEDVDAIFSAMVAQLLADAGTPAVTASRSGAYDEDFGGSTCEFTGHEDHLSALVDHICGEDTPAAAHHKSRIRR